MQWGFVNVVFDSNHWSSIFSLDMVLKAQTEQTLDSVSYNFRFYLLYLLGVETKIFGDKLRSTSEFLNNENIVFVGTLISRMYHIFVKNLHRVNIKTNIFFKVI